MPTFGSLFAGIGGLDLGLERAGWTCRWQVEIDPFCQRVLAKHWPDVRRYADVRAFPGPDAEPVDLICGGFPCQPVSVAGKRLAQSDERWLWPEFSRVIRALRPRLVLVENVPGLLVRGVGDVLGDLAASGYDAEWDCISALAVGAPHIRDRVWLVAYPDERRIHADEAIRAGWHAVGLGDQDMVNADGERPSYRGEGATGGGEPSEGERDYSAVIAPGARRRAAIFSDADSESLGRLAESRGQCGQWATEPDVGRVAHGVPARVDRLRGLGNAVVPQVAEWIGRRLLTCLR